jgi:hypothetical protein
LRLAAKDANWLAVEVDSKTNVWRSDGGAAAGRKKKARPGKAEPYRTAGGTAARGAEPGLVGGTDFFTASEPYCTAGAIGAGGRWRRWLGNSIFSHLRSLPAMRAAKLREKLALRGRHGGFFHSLQRLQKWSGSRDRYQSNSIGLGFSGSA